MRPEKKLPPSGAASRLPWLDALRGAAALAVVGHHFYVVILHGFAADSALRVAWPVRWFMAVAHWGTLGVPVFFVLSGFCVGQTWLRARSWNDFAMRRLRRIFPAYYASLALVLGCAVAAKFAGGVNDVAAFPAPTFGHALATVTLLTSPATTVPSICWVYWSLSYEIVFYAILALTRSLPERARLGTVVAVNSAACALTFLPLLAPRPGPLFFCDLWPLFGLGLALALAARSRLAAWCVGAPALLGLIPVWQNPIYPGFVVVGLSAAGAVWLIAHAAPSWRLPALERIGDFSYSLYLTHVPVLLLVDRWFVLPATAPGWLFGGMALTVATQLVVAWLFCRMFEKPFLHARRTPATQRPTSHSSTSTAPTL